MAYSDFEMKNFTQVAYADFKEAFDYLKKVCPDRDSFTIAELAAVGKGLNPSVDYGCLDCLTDEQYHNWKISWVQDSNAQTGFYACVIETAPNEAAVAFRGSESYHDPSNLLNDWIRSDFGLLNSTETIQHAEVKRFLEEQTNSPDNVFARYDKLSITGHSLGGNLAEYATIISGKYGLDGKIEKCISFDGPGFSNEFITRYHKEISAMSGKMTHYQWSLVGTLLFSLPGVERVVCEVSNDANTKDKEKYNHLTRHDTKYLVFDKNGKVKKGSKDDLAIFTSIFSKFIDGKFNHINVGLIVLPYMLITKGYATAKEIFESISKGLQTTYQNIKNFLDKWFNRNDAYFRVNTSSLNSDTESVSSKIEYVRRMVGEMFQSIQGLNAMWKGPANAAFAAKFAKEQEEINTYLDKIKTYTDALEADSRAYTSCEQRALDIISSLRF